MAFKTSMEIHINMAKLGVAKKTKTRISTAPSVVLRTCQQFGERRFGLVLGVDPRAWGGPQCCFPKWPYGEPLYQAARGFTHAKPAASGLYSNGLAIS